MEDFNITRNDVNIIGKGMTETFIHVDGLFMPFSIDRMNKFPYYKDLYVTATHKLKLCIHFAYIDYFIVDEQGVCMDRMFRTFAEAKVAADEYDKNYSTWVKERSTKGWSKNRLKENILKGNMEAKLVYAIDKRKSLDMDYHLLTIGHKPERIIINRPNDMATSIFYMKSMKASLINYSQDSLKIYLPGFRLCNEQERTVMEQWEKQRDYKEEMVDIMTDSSVQYWKKKYFFEENGCGHLLIQQFKGLVRDDKIRGPLQLSYEIQRF